VAGELNRLAAELCGGKLQILAFPCNQFGRQEPGTDLSIQKAARDPSCATRAEFPVFGKIDVNGKRAAPLFRYLNRAAPGLLGREMVLWNFTKYLVDADGHVVYRYGTPTPPSAMRKDILKLVDATPSLAPALPRTTSPASDAEDEASIDESKTDPTAEAAAVEPPPPPPPKDGTGCEADAPTTPAAAETASSS